MGGGVHFSAAPEIHQPRERHLVPPPPRRGREPRLMLSDLASAFGHRLGESDCRALPDADPVLKGPTIAAFLRTMTLRRAGAHSTALLVLIQAPTKPSK